jgi:hypothetical protein
MFPVYSVTYLPGCAQKEVLPMFDLDRFKADCGAALAERAPVQAVREVVALAVEAPGAVLKALGEPLRSEVQTLHRSSDLTILNVIWGPLMAVMPHNHEMWAVIGIYTGARTTSYGAGCRARLMVESKPQAPRR